MWLFLYLLISKVVSGEIYTITKNENITCVLTEESAYSALYISVPNQKVPLEAKRPLTELTQWVTDDWNLTNTGYHPYEPVMDIRWQDFKKLEGGKIELKDAENGATSFSVCFNNRLTVTASDGYFNMEFIQLYQEPEKTRKLLQENHDPQCTWSHYVITENQIFQVVRSNGIQEMKNVWSTSFAPRALIFGTKNVNIKLHEYDFRVSYLTNIRHSMSYLDISNVTNSENLCISMFVSIDEDCYLQIILESGNASHNVMVKGFNENKKLKKWKRIEITTDKYDGTGTLKFYRLGTSIGRYGYWAIDKVHLCRPKIETYQTQLNSKNAICRSTNSSQNFFCNKTGFLGHDCAISCDKVLGDEYPSCQGHTICAENGTCECAWGYHGESCNTTCDEGYWGLNCASRYDLERCEDHNNIIGCSACAKKFFGEQCSEKLPFVLQAPLLTSIQEDSIEISLILKHNEDGVEPQFYQIQYKQIGSKSFKNYSDLAPYSGTNQRVTLQNLAPKKFGYQIRVILVVQNAFLDENVPELITHKKSLKASVDVSGVELTWDNPSTEKRVYNKFLVKYMWTKEFCSNQIMNNTITTSRNGAKIENVTHFSVVVVKLYAEIEEELIDQIIVMPSTATTKIEEAELPKDVSFSKNEIVLSFEKCDKFSGPITYFLNYKCVSEWCQKKTAKSTKFDMNKYESTVKRRVEEASFGVYEIEVTANRSDQKLSRYFNRTSEPSKPQAVQNLSLYSSTDRTLWIKWTDAYPPTGFVELYNITYQNKKNKKTFYSTGGLRCDFWGKSMCANLTNLDKETVYVITVQAKNFNVSEWSEPTVLPTSSKRRETEAPQNVQIKLTSRSNEIILSWEYPLYTNGLLDEFCVQVDETNYTTSVKKYGHKYEYKISVEHHKDYTISVWGKNLFVGKKATITATILSPIAEYSLSPLVEWCSTKCHLLVPNHNQINFEIFVMKKDEAISLQEIKTRYKNKSQKDQWIVQQPPKSDVLELEIGETPFKAISVKNQNYKMYFMPEDDDLNLAAYPIQTAKKQELWFEAHVLSVLLGASCVSTIVALLAYFYFKSKKENQNLEKKDEMALLSFERSSRDIKIEKLETILKIYFANHFVSEEFLFLPTEAAETCLVGSKSENVSKNKDRNFLPYDSTRVVLQELKGVGSDDYINASYIDGYDRPKAYIACQGPKFSTVCDFWRMVWQEQVETIVMATNFTEIDGSRMCAEYWSEGSSCEFGKLKIKMVSKEAYQNYDHRIFEVLYFGTTRKIQHFLLKWKSDKQFYPDDVLPVLKRLTELSAASFSPIVVHSGLGINRNGTLILCDLALKMAKIEKSVNFGALLERMREQRPHMVDNMEYYKLAQLSVLEFMMEQENPFNKSFDEILSSSVTEQLSFLERLYWHDEVLQSGLVPPSNNNKSLQITFVDGYQKENQFLICEEPTQKLVSEFWKIVRNEQIKYILFLNSLKEKLWPCTFDNSDVTVKVIQVSHIQLTPGYAVTQLLQLTCDTATKEVLRESEVWFFELKDWDPQELVPKSTTNIFTVLEDVQKFVAANHIPVLVTCCDGNNATGLFSILFHVLNKYEKELEIDVCQAIRVVKRRDPKFSIHPNQLKFLYSLILEYFQKFEKYKHIYKTNEGRTFVSK